CARQNSWRPENYFEDW
nr:immunoglobulin heavy chain junction region [Macaca mulatta]MOV45657.1 immunoglobulin heavy chain junction region [Macaca mulatta]MOV46057.1 immunoglobulin heavy chain junction region [Macaca mulatta]